MRLIEILLGCRSKEFSFQDIKLIINIMNIDICEIGIETIRSTLFTEEIFSGISCHIRLVYVWQYFQTFDMGVVHHALITSWTNKAVDRLLAHLHIYL